MAEPLEHLNSNQAAVTAPLVGRTKIKAQTSTAPGRTYRPTIDYDYYDDEDVRVVGNTSGQQVI